MPLPTSLLTPAAAAQYVEEAALLAGLPRSAWDSASDTSKQAALDAGWAAIATRPGYRLYDHTGDKAVRLACVVEALSRLDAQADSGATARARLQAQGVQEAQVGGVREVYRPRAGLHPATLSLLAPYRRPVGLA